MAYTPTDALAACLAVHHPAAFGTLETLVRRVLNHDLPQPSHADLNALQSEIDVVLPPGRDQLTLVYGGATKVQEYVFESPKLPEIRGASALLDWVNRDRLLDLWCEQLGPVFANQLGLDLASGQYLAEACMIYQAGGKFLAIAPQGYGPALADLVEHTYTAETLTAQSIAVSEDVGLLSLRYGRQPLRYWVEHFLRDWHVGTPATALISADRQRRAALAAYYGPLPDADPSDERSETLQQRFHHRKTFGELVTLLTAAFYRRRLERTSTVGQPRQPRDVAVYPLLPWNAKCASSDIRPAVRHGSIGDGDERRMLSEASARKRYVGQLVKQDEALTRWFRERFAWDPSIQSWETAWETYLERHPESAYARAVRAGGVAGAVRPAHDVQEIGATSGRYIGLIYADGNNIGQLIAAQRSLQAYADKAQQLRETTEAAVFDALAAQLRPYELTPRGRWVHPFEILTIGGDDLLLIVPGDQALALALAIGVNFERRLGPDPDPARPPDRYVAAPDTLTIDHAYHPRIGLSAGVIIAQENAPIFFLRNLVEDLLKNAKAFARARAAQTGDRSGAIDFMVLKSITMVIDDIAAFRRAALGDDGKYTGPATRRVTARPYTWHEVDGLLQTVRLLQAVRMPRSQLHRIQEVLQDTRASSIMAGTLEYLHTRARMRSDRAELLLTAIERAWRGAIPGVPMPDVPPWLRMAQGGWETIWSDLVEIYDLVQQEAYEPA